MSNVFEDLEKDMSNSDYANIFKDKLPLDHRYLPEKLVHREDQIKQIAKYWVDVLNNVTPSNVTLYGKTGTGKTAASKFAREQLIEIASKKNIFVKVEYIRCTDYNTEYQILAKLCPLLGKPVPFRGWTKAEVVNTFRNLFKSNSLGDDLILIVILDEIGRGTSTYDGMSIARSVLEYVTDKKTLGAKTLFATHYHELTILENLMDGVKNYNIAVKKRGFDITFLRRIVPGGADESYGVEVAKLAGIPESIIMRAKEVLSELEGQSDNKPITQKVSQNTNTEETLFSLLDTGNNKIIDELRNIDINTLTPIEAMKKLYDLVGMAKDT